MTLQTSFEKETCGRCSGSGEHSYNQLHGKVCYGCNGKGERLTKRGSVAAQFYRASCEAMAKDVAAGDTIEINGVMPNGTLYKQRAVVLSIEIEGERVSLNTKDMTTVRGLTSKIRKYWNAEENAAKIAAALAYQSTLTQAGTPAKRKQGV